MNMPEEIQPQLTRREIWLGRCYLPVHMFVLPILLAVFPRVTGITISTGRSNALYYAISIVYVLLCMGPFLRRTLEQFCSYPGWCFWSAVSGYFLYIFFSWIVGLIAVLILKDNVSLPNNDLISELLRSNFQAICPVLVLIAPVVEESLFRGALFGGALAKGRRMTGYVVSTVLFALYHVWQLPFSGYPWTSLLYGLIYIPAGVVLARTYEMSSSLWSSILLHAAINTMSMLVMLNM